VCSEVKPETDNSWRDSHSRRSRYSCAFKDPNDSGRLFKAEQRLSSSHVSLVREETPVGKLSRTEQPDNTSLDKLSKELIDLGQVLKFGHDRNIKEPRFCMLRANSLGNAISRHLEISRQVIDGPRKSEEGNLLQHFNTRCRSIFCSTTWKFRLPSQASHNHEGRS
jgi:hypothetical protein